MGTELLIALAATAAGAGVNAYNQRQTAKREDEQATQGLLSQYARQREADAAVDSQVDALKGSGPEAARADATAQFLAQLRRSRASAEGAVSPIEGGRYASDLTAANEENAALGDRTAKILARINAPSAQRAAEGEGFAQLASNIQGIGRNSQADAFLNELRMRRIRPDTGLAIAGDVITGAGKGIASKGGRGYPAGKTTGYRPVDLNKGITVTAGRR